MTCVSMHKSPSQHLRQCTLNCTCFCLEGCLHQLVWLTSVISSKLLIGAEKFHHQSSLCNMFAHYKQCGMTRMTSVMRWMQQAIGNPHCYTVFRIGLPTKNEVEPPKLSCNLTNNSMAFTCTFNSATVAPISHRWGGSLRIPTEWSWMKACMTLFSNFSLQHCPQMIVFYG